MRKFPHVLDGNETRSGGQDHSEILGQTLVDPQQLGVFVLVIVGSDEA